MGQNPEYSGDFPRLGGILDKKASGPTSGNDDPEAAKKEVTETFLYNIHPPHVYRGFPSF
jgi:hypothetical protein